VAVLHIALLASVGNTSQLPLACELLMQHLKLVDEFLAYRSEDIAGRDGPICLYPYE
jgi:hypothetical protein